MIPADRKWFMRIAVAAILVHIWRTWIREFPEPTAEDRAKMDAAVKRSRRSESAGGRAARAGQWAYE